MSDATAFPTVFRGYDPAAVEQAMHSLKAGQAAALQESAQKGVEITKLNAANNSLAQELANLRSRVEELEVALQTAEAEAVPPTFADLGPRVSQILILAEEEAAELRGKAEAEAAAVRADADQVSQEVRSAADAYSTEVRSEADAKAAKILELAKRDADDMVDHAEREASARRGEAEALFESQRAAAGAAAADFEKTLAARRDKAQTEFQQQMSAHEADIAAAEEKLASLQAEAQKTKEDADADARQTRETAQAQATQLVEAARANAERVRRDSERELAALASRRDSITGQLANVRQMLATLGGASLAQVDAALQQPSATADQGKDGEMSPEPEVTDSADQVEVEQLAGEAGEVDEGMPAEAVE